ncbi:hypothetical protein [Halorussus sp. AFM4]|uniref:hypothetical protein n=1 Tax=Halorussus sp. AFM4 TaxID=3421651 RepID=UPI003EBF14B5
MGDAERAEMSRQVYSEFETLRQMGTDFTDLEEVVSRLDAYNFEAAIDWLLDHPEAYQRMVVDGTGDETTGRRGS